MGTTQRIANGVKKEPNWGNLTSSVTSAAKAIADLENEEEKDTPTNEKDLEQQARRVNQLTKRRDNHVRSAFKWLAKIGGGSSNISSGKSAKIGKAGIKSTGKLVSFFAQTSSTGLEDALNQIGFGSLVGKTVRDVIDYLIAFCGNSSVGMDETASNEAIAEVLREIETEGDGTVENLEEIFKGYADTEKLSELLCKFFGVYIFEYLSERLEERLSQIRGEFVAKETFDCIKKDIQGRVTRLNDSRPVAKIDWAGQEGNREIEKIFESIIKIEE